MTTSMDDADLQQMAVKESTRPQRALLSKGLNALRANFIGDAGPVLLNAAQLRGTGGRVPNRLLLLDDNGELQYFGLLGAESDTASFRIGDVPDLAPRDREVILFGGEVKEAIMATLSSGAQLPCRLGPGRTSIIVTWD
jgi:hypothetical protein